MQTYDALQANFCRQQKRFTSLSVRPKTRHIDENPHTVICGGEWNSGVSVDVPYLNCCHAKEWMMLPPLYLQNFRLKCGWADAIKGLETEP